MRKWLVVAALGTIAAVQVACSSDDTVVGAPTGGSGGASGAGGTGGKAGTGGTGGTAGSKASGAGGAAGAAGTGNGGGGAGGAAGAGGDGGMGGAGGTNVVDPCAGKYSPLPFVVSSAFTNLRICSSGTCTAPAMPYYFAAIPNPNCDEAFPDGGIVPPFADAGVEGGTPADPDAGDAGSDGADAAPLPVADASDTADAGAGADADAGANSADVTAAVDAVGSGDAPADASLGTDARAEASPEAASGDGGAPSCYEFLYNPACTTGTCWGGVIFTQSAGSNADPGVCIESGATKISFKAKASRADARIKFGSIREGLGATEYFMNITTEWATYEVAIPAGEPYNNYSAGGTGVWNGFSVIVEPGDHPGGTYIFVKDAVWMK